MACFAWLGWTEAAALTWLSLLTELGQQETKRREAWGLEGGPSQVPPWFPVHSAGKGLPTPSHPCPLPAPAQAWEGRVSPCRRGTRSYPSPEDSQRMFNVATLPHPPREGLNTLPSEKSGP